MSNKPTHLAAVSPGKGQSFELQSRFTPKPGPGEVLIAVKSVALNPADYHMRDKGLFIPAYPTVIGFDISGLVLEVGVNVPSGAADQNDLALSFQPGVTRVAAYAAAFWKSFDSDYGAFQERCLVPWQHCVPLPNENISWNHAATLPVAVAVTLSVWDTLQIPRTGGAPISAPTATSASTGINTDEGAQNVSQQRKEALLVWGASSSVGTMGVQGAQLLREDRSTCFAAVYATAGSANHDYVRSLGADRVFDYNDPQVVQAIISAALEDGLVIRRCFLATGQLPPCQAVLKAFLGENEDGQKKARIGSAPIVPPGANVVDGIETIFVQPSMEEGERLKQFQYWMGTWLREQLTQGNIRPSPEPRIAGKGLGSIDTALDRLVQGVSCTKLVVEIEE